MADEVRCADCGYLALRAYPSRKLDEADGEFRQTGSVPVNAGHQVHTHDHPICFRQAYDLKAETPEPTSATRLACIKKERHCERFTVWQQGLGPREHFEMMLSEKLLEEQRMRDESQRQWERERFALEQQRDEAQRKWRREDRWSALAMLIVAATAGILGCLATLIAGGQLPWFG